MKTRLMFLYLVLLTLNSYSQTFEGKIEYEIQFTSKMKNYTDEDLEVIIGTKQEYFIKQAKYKSFLNGQSVVMQVYEDSLNRLYSRSAKSDTLYWFDASINSDTVLAYKIEKKSAKVLGITCDAIVMTTVTGKTTIFYSNKYKLESRLFKNHKYNNWAFYTSKVNSLPLKIITETKNFKMVSTAIEIKPLALSWEFFQLDVKVPLKKG